MTEYQVSLCDDGQWMVHTVGDIIAYPGQGDEEEKARMICAALNKEPVAWEATDPDLNPNATLTRDQGVADIWRKAGLTVRGLYTK